MSLFESTAKRVLGLDGPTVLVLRVEDLEGYGPYRSRGGDPLRMNFRHANDTHPNIWDDPGLVTPLEDARYHHEEHLIRAWGMSDYRFGFSSLSHLKGWFSQVDREDLETYGFTIKVYRVPSKHVKTGKYQSIFDPTLAAVLFSVSPLRIDSLQEVLDAQH